MPSARLAVVKLAIVLTTLATFASCDTKAAFAWNDEIDCCTIPSTLLATFDNSVSETVITLGAQDVPFQSNPYPNNGETLTVSTSAKALILAKVKLAYALEFV